MAQDVITQAQIAQVRASLRQRPQGRGLLPFELPDFLTILLQSFGYGSHQLRRLLVGQRPIHRVLAQRLCGVLEVIDSLSIGLLLRAQRDVLGDGSAPGAPGIAGPEAHRQGQGYYQQQAAPPEHQHTALPGHPAAM